MYEFWNNYVKPKYGEKAKLCCIRKNMIFIKKLQKMLKKGLPTQIVN